MTKPINDEFVVVYLIDKDLKEIYYLEKDKPHMYWLHKKLVGWGGKLKKGEDMYVGAIRELGQELGLRVNGKNLIYQGKFRDERKDWVYVLKYNLEERLKEGLIENEGIAMYKPLGYHRKHRGEFPERNFIIEEAVFSDVDFKIKF